MVSSPVGEVDWNTAVCITVSGAVCVFPCGGSGLKFISHMHLDFMVNVSSPVGEVDWNEDEDMRSLFHMSVFPCGGSGLKFLCIAFSSRPVSCLPLWGKWIEILSSLQALDETAVSSPVGEVDWNENKKTNEKVVGIVSSPVGEVDWNTVCRLFGFPFFVSSPVGEVDWNVKMRILGKKWIACLPLWGKWIEIGNPISNDCSGMCLPLWGKWIEIWERYY